MLLAAPAIYGLPGWFRIHECGNCYLPVAEKLGRIVVGGLIVRAFSWLGYEMRVIVGR